MFYTPLHIPSSNIRITHQSNILTLGSCFSDEIGNLLLKHKFNVEVNPMGVVFNPISISDILECVLSGNISTLNHFVERDGLYFSYGLHSSLFGYSENDLISKIEKKIYLLNNFIKSTDILIITLGSAYVYAHTTTKKIVSNCHKQPSSFFSKSLLNVSEVVDVLKKIFEQLHLLLPNIKIILTVSPVRHTKDTLPLNCVSKSVLRLACHHLCEQLDYIEYFPAYEIMIDELRDYRFYKKDMIHPNDIAIEHIWNKFSITYFPDETRDINSLWREINQALEHKPFFEHSNAYQLFLRQTLSKLEKLSAYINVTKEIEELNNKITRLQ
ncbi:MAG: GSCFA domain-containing protein [Cytophagaceae bacterium]|nr:GSCFA domain-containing protein [Cytophagaceae bacterium]MDW8456624.1 GSCFA domain-containing protein [Cytophagaceae bacterium]